MMWGFGGRYYWGRKQRGKVEGIVVVFAWMSSQEKHLKNYVGLYGSRGWNSLVCQSQFLNMFFPDKAASLALEIVNELTQVQKNCFIKCLRCGSTLRSFPDKNWDLELKVRPCPVVFASFSGGPKACMYKVLQIIEGKCVEKPNLGDYRLVRDCVSGHIFDSTPVDFVSDVGIRFILHPTVLGMSRPPPLASSIANESWGSFSHILL